MCGGSPVRFRRRPEPAFPMTNLPHIIEGTWHDPDPDPVLGAKSSPWGFSAVRLVIGGRALLFPSAEAALAFEAEFHKENQA